MDEPQAEPEEQEMHNPREGSSLEAFLEMPGGLIIKVNLMVTWLTGILMRT